MILDTNALSAFVDGAADLTPLLTEAFAIPVIVLGEYRFWNPAIAPAFGS